MAEPTPAAAAEAPPKSKKKLLLVIAAAAVVVIGGGAGSYFAFFNGKSDQTAQDGKGDKDKNAKDKNSKDKKKAKEEDKKPKLPAQFVALDPPFVVNFEPGSTARFLQITVQLMTREPEMVEFLKNNTPIIRNDLLLLFGNRHVEEVSTNEGKEALRKAALDAVRKIVSNEGGKADALEAVYFTSFVMQ
jgi:flagellar FliL protein